MRLIFDCESACRGCDSAFRVHGSACRVLKGTWQWGRFSGFLHKSVPYESLTLSFVLFWFWLRICGDIRNRKTTSPNRHLSSIIYHFSLVKAAINVNCVKTVLMALTSAQWCYQKSINRRIMTFRLSPDRIGPLGKPPASLALLPSRTSSHMCSCPALLELQRWYEAIQLWSYTTFIVNKALVNRKLAVKT